MHALLILLSSTAKDAGPAATVSRNPLAVDGRDVVTLMVAAGGVNPLWLAQSRLRRRRYDECIGLCSSALQHNPLDQASVCCAGHSCELRTVQQHHNMRAGLQSAGAVVCLFVVSDDPVVYQQVAWYLKCRAITLKAWVDDSELEEEVSRRVLFQLHDMCHSCVSHAEPIIIIM